MGKFDFIDFENVYERALKSKQCQSDDWANGFTEGYKQAIEGLDSLHPKSHIIIEIATNTPIVELFDSKFPSLLKKEYRAVPIAEYLAGLNKKNKP